MPPAEIPAAPNLIRASGAGLAAAARAWLLEALHAGRGRLVGLAVGSSTLPLYGDLPADDPAWTERTIVPVDELMPPPADPDQRFASRLRRALPAALAARVDDLPTDPATLETRIEEQGLAAVLLGLGPDGHVAFNQPGSRAADGVRIVALAPANLARLGGVAPAALALTIGLGTIMRAERVAIIAAGPGKQAALLRLLEGPAGDDVPVSHLRRHPSLTVIMGETCA